MDGAPDKRSYLLAFKSSFGAMAAQKALAPYRPHVIPVPREIDVGCGMALQFFAADDKAARAIAQAAGLDEEDAGDLYLSEGGAYRLMGAD